MSTKPQVTAKEPFSADTCCSLCGRRLRRQKPYVWFCNRCYRGWKEAIISREGWVEGLIKLERSRRYKIRTMRELGISLIYIGLKFDMDEDGNIVRRFGSNDG